MSTSMRVIPRAALRSALRHRLKGKATRRANRAARSTCSSSAAARSSALGARTSSGAPARAGISQGDRVTGREGARASFRDFDVRCSPRSELSQGEWETRRIRRPRETKPLVSLIRPTQPSAEASHRSSHAQHRRWLAWTLPSSASGSSVSPVLPVTRSDGSPLGSPSQIETSPLKNLSSSPLLPVHPSRSALRQEAASVATQGEPQRPGANACGAKPGRPCAERHDTRAGGGAGAPAADARGRARERSRSSSAVLLRLTTEDVRLMTATSLFRLFGFSRARLSS